MKETFFADSLVKWYKIHKRDLPWRNTLNPYFIWLSEVLLQQTRVQQGLPYYNKFIESFPTVQDLAAASEKDVLMLWQGLGYYSRARNLHTAAKYVVNELKGKFPDSFADLIKLKGVGSYTASAIASFAFQENVAVLDGNVFRVLARVFGIHTDIGSGIGAKEFAKLAHLLLPEKNTATYNQAIMEFGALHCTPALPLCNICPLAAMCLANLNGIQNKLPVKINKVKKKIRYFNYIVFQYEDHLLLKVRSDKDIWNGLYEFANFEKEALIGPDELMDFIDDAREHLVLKSISKDFKHLLTHQTLFARFTVIQINSKNTLRKILNKFNLSLFSIEEITQLPKPVLIIKFLENFQIH